MKNIESDLVLFSPDTVFIVDFKTKALTSSIPNIKINATLSVGKNMIYCLFPEVS